MNSAQKLNQPRIAEKKNQLDVTECFVALMICSTRFGHFHVHHQGALDYMCVIAAYGVQCLVCGCRKSGAGKQGVRPARGTLHVVQHPSS